MWCVISICDRGGRFVRLVEGLAFRKRRLLLIISYGLFFLSVSSFLFLSSFADISLLAEEFYSIVAALDYLHLSLSWHYLALSSLIT